MRDKISQFCAIFNNWHGPCFLPDMTAGSTGGLNQGVEIMVLNITHLQQLAVSLVGALVASTLFVSAAVGPVGQFI